MREEVIELTNGRKAVLGGRQTPAPAKPAFRHLTSGGTIPTPPVSVDYAPLAAAALSQYEANDVYGDCVIASDMHHLGVATANAGHPFIATTAQAVADYSTFCGFDPRDPRATDNGCNVQSVLNGRLSRGYPNGTKLIQWIPLDPANVVAVKQAVWLFLFGQGGFSMPDAWVSGMRTMESGFVWDVAGPPNGNNGHSTFNAVGYNSRGIKISTWGMTGTLTWGAAAYYLAAAQGGEFYTGLSTNILNPATGLTPSGATWPATVQFFNELGGSIPVPAPTPTPTPAPVPVVVPPTPTPPVIVPPVTPPATPAHWYPLTIAYNGVTILDGMFADRNIPGNS